MGETISNEVNTVFTVTDRSSGPQKQIAQQAEKMATSAQRAQKALDLRVESRPGAGIEPGSVAPAAAEPTGRGRGVNALAMARERAMFAEDRAEFQLRRKRMRHQKLELAREQVFHRIGEMALMSVIGEQGKYSSALARGGATFQAVGTQLTAFGGMTGKVGGALAMLGGYGAAAGLALEGVSAVAKLFGVDMDEVISIGLKDLKRGLGIGDKAEKLAKEMGYHSAAERDVAQKLSEQWFLETQLNEDIQRLSSKLPTLPISETGQAMETFHRAALDLAKQIPGGDLKEKISKIEEAARRSTASQAARYAHEQELNETIEKEVLPHLRALPLKPTAKNLTDLNTVIGGYVESLAAQQTISNEEKTATVELIRKKLEEHGTVEGAITRYREQEHVQAVMDEQVRRQVHSLKVIPLNTTAARTIAFNDQLAKMALHMAELSHWSPEQTTEYLTKLKEAATEKSQRVFDFRNSRFDIKQAFADTDPDRIAVAFANDLAGLGERKVQSAFAPLFAI